jgi:apolipoprotein N-acyltransferase
VRPRAPAGEVPAATPAERRPALAGTLLVGLVASTWVFAFAPRPWAAATLPGVVGLLALAERARRTRHAVAWVVLVGALAIGAGYAWIAPTVRTFGELDQRLGALAAPASWLALAAYGIAATVHLGLFAALHRATLRGGRRPHPMVTALLFVACETLPVRFLPWMAGYGAVDVGALRQTAAWGGVPLVSFALLCLCVPFHEGLRWAAGRPARPRAAAATLLAGLLLCAGGWWEARRVEAEDASPDRQTVRVGLVQAGVGSHAKRAAERLREGETRRSHEAYEAGTRRAAAAGADLIVWPESALVEGLRVWDAARGEPWPAADVDLHLRRLGYGFLTEVGRDHALLLGGYEDEEGAAPGPDGRRSRRFNVAMLREAGGAGWSIYRKVKLMPFGETMPGASVVPSLADLLPQSFRMAAGEPDQPPLAWKARGLSICAFVCYESILPGLVARLAGDRRPDLLVNLTNDSWYGDSWEPRQHLNFARFRAVEHRAPMLRATNTGISAVVSATGEVTHRLGYGEVGEIVADVPIVPRSRTLYARIATGLPWAIWLAGLAALLGTALRRHPPGAHPPGARPA